MKRRQALKSGVALAATVATATLGFPALAKSDDKELFAMSRNRQPLTGM